MNNIIAVVVTYNRRDLLQRVIESLRKQTVPLSSIIVVNNGSTDGTREWLDRQEGMSVIHQENVGGSGGFYRGIQEAMKQDCDWIWCMDDDVFPTETCLVQLLLHADDSIGILCPRRMMDGKPFHSESKKVNLSNPFKNTYDYPLTAKEVDNNAVADMEGMAFEGPLIRRSVVEKIGLPNKDLFILYDDTDYSYRAILAGYRVVLVRDAILVKHNFASSSSKSEKEIAYNWKLAYHIRNSAYFCHHYGKNFFVRNFGTLHFVLRMYVVITFKPTQREKYSKADYSLYWRMMRKGMREELGKM